MSESASDPKVEDVLSSVRRLVSGELPRKPRPDLPEGPGALVLTPADRIEESPKVRAASKSLEERIAELEAAVGDRGDEFEPDGSEDQSQHRPDRIVYTRPPSGDEVAEARRSTLRLSQIALIETGPANNEDDAESDATAEFHHEEDHADEADEAPMAVDVPPERPAPAEVAAFTNPDDVVARLEARLEGNQPPVPPAAPTRVSVELDMEDQAFEDALSEAVGNGGETGPADDADAWEEDAEEAAQAPERAADLDRQDEPAVSDGVDAPAAFETGDELGVAEAFEIVEDSLEEQAQDDDAQDGGPQDDGAQAGEPDTDSEDATTSVFAAHMDDADTDTGDEIHEAAAASPYALTDAPADEPDLPEVAPRPAEDATSADPAAALVSAALDKLADEDATRLLVARLIREELQGDLGERITRNVRKLVRREILRALNSRDLT